MNNLQLFNADCRDIMRNMADGSIDLILTDPPYYSTELHFDKDERIDFAAWLRECRRVLKDDGILLTFGDFNLIAELKTASPFKSFYELIWAKTMPTGIFDANKRPLRAHEYIAFFSDAFVKSAYNPQFLQGEAYQRRRSGNPAHYSQTASRQDTTSDGRRYPTSVLTFSNGTGGQGVHPTQKPVDLLANLIAQYSNEGDVVLDCFMGSGSTGVAAVKLKRRFVGVELDKNYFGIAQKRIFDAAHDLELMFA